MARLARSRHYDIVGTGKRRRLRCTFAYDFPAYEFRSGAKLGERLKKLAAKFWNNALKTVSKFESETGFQAGDFTTYAEYELQTLASWTKKGNISEPFNLFNHYTKRDATFRTMQSRVRSVGDQDKLDEIKQLGEARTDTDPWRLKAIAITFRFLGLEGKVPDIGLEESGSYSEETRRLLAGVLPDRERRVKPKQPKKKQASDRDSKGKFVKRAKDGEGKKLSDADAIRAAWKASKQISNEELYRMFPHIPKPSVRRNINKLRK